MTRQNINTREGKKQDIAGVGPKVHAKGKEKEQIPVESEKRKTPANKPLVTLRTLVWRPRLKDKHFEDRNKERLAGKNKDMGSTKFGEVSGFAAESTS